MHELKGNSALGHSPDAQGGLLAGFGQVSTGVGIYSTAGAADATLNPESISNTGGGQPVSTESPYLAVNFVIALVGLYPSRS
ncbi:MAG: microcystin-dependent protein [Kiritimatiellia bacterium]|jgi:microcystin-dependent protein